MAGILQLGYDSLGFRVIDEATGGGQAGSIDEPRRSDPATAGEKCRPKSHGGYAVDVVAILDGDRPIDELDGVREELAYAPVASHPDAPQVDLGEIVRGQNGLVREDGALASQSDGNRELGEAVSGSLVHEVDPGSNAAQCPTSGELAHLDRGHVSGFSFAHGDHAMRIEGELAQDPSIGQSRPPGNSVPILVRYCQMDARVRSRRMTETAAPQGHRAPPRRSFRSDHQSRTLVSYTRT